MFSSFPRSVVLALALLPWACLPLAQAAPVITATQDDATGATVRKAPGDTVTYTVTISNGGDAAATNVQLTDPAATNTTDTGPVLVTPLALDDSYSATVISGIGVDTATSSGYSVGSNDYAGAPAAMISAFSAASAHGGVVTVRANGTFTYVSAPGYTGADTFTYTLSNTAGSSTGTVSLTVAASPVIWFVNPAAASTGNGTLASPFKTVAEAVTAIGANTGQRIFLYSGAQTTGITLRASGWLVGQGAIGTSFDTVMGITPGADSAARPAVNGTRPALSNGANTVLTLAEANTVLGVALTGGATGVAVNAGAVNAGTVGADVTISGAAGGAFASTGGNGAFTLGAAITSATGRPIFVSNRTGGTMTFSGAITDTGTGVSLTTNTGATINFTGDISANTGANVAFNATGGGTVNVTGANNTLTTTTGAALNVANTTIGASGLAFRSISANGAANGIVLNSTGATAGLTVTGDGNTSVGGNNSGGTIQNTTGHGISLSNTRSPSFTNLNIQTTAGSGVFGSQVTNFTFKNGKINASGTALFVTETSNIAFNTTTAGTETNLTGSVQITGNQLANAFYHGVDIFNYNGTIADANISSNTITSSTNTATTKGTGIRLVAFGSATTAASVTKAEIDANTITNFVSANGILASSGNGNTSGTANAFGSNTANPIAITNNVLNGGAGKFGAFGMAATVNGKGTAFFKIHNNSITNSIGTALSIGAFGNTTSTVIVTHNTIVANHSLNTGAQGIGAGTSQTFGASDTPTLNIRIGDGTAAGANNISQTGGNGILVTARDATGHVNARILTNTVAKPLGGLREGIRVDAGNAVSVDDEINLEISGNTSAGTTSGTNTAPGIGLRKQGTVTTTNDFKIVGLTATSSPGVETYVSGQNPGSAAGNFGTGGTDLISATSGFSAGTTMSFLIYAPGGVARASDLQATTRASFATDLSTETSNAISQVPLPLRKDDAAPAARESVPTSSGRVPSSLTQADLDTLVTAATARWEASDLTSEQLVCLRALKFEVSDLPGQRLGEAEANVIRVSSHAAGNSWFIDAAPCIDTAFSHALSASRRNTDPTSVAAGRVDLLTAILHEMGHALGLPDSYDFEDRDSLMFGYLTVGERRLPARSQAAGAVPGALGGAPHFLGSPVTIPTLSPGRSVTVTYQVQIANVATFPKSVGSISSRGTVTADGGISVPTNDIVGGTLTGSGPTVTLVTVAPVISDVPKTANEGTALAFAATDFTSRYSDANGDTLATVRLTSLPTGGTLKNGAATISTVPTDIALASIGNLTFTSNAGFAGLTSFGWAAVDSSGAVSTGASVNITVIGKPVAVAQSVTTNQDTAQAVTLSATDPNMPARTLTYTVTVNPAHGTLSGTAPNLTYTPTAGYFGADSFQFKVNNGAIDSAVAMVSISVVGKPTANTQTVSTPVNTAKAVTLTGSDPNTPARTLTYTVAAQPAHGALSGTAPSLTYTPANNYVGGDSFTFTVDNGAITSTAATVSISVTGTAPAITSVNTKVFTVGAGNTFSVTATGLPIPALSASGALPGGVTFVDNGNGTATLSGNPAAGSNASYGLTITANNGVNPAASQSFTLVINRPPVAGASTLGTTQNTAVTASVAKLLTGASDPDGDPLSVASVTAGSANGTVVLSTPGAAGTITYTPANNFTGSDSFTYILSDGRGGTAIVAVSVTVDPAGNHTLNVVSIARTASAVTVVYAGIPGDSYQPQFADTMDGGPWTNAGPPLTAGTNGQFTYVDSTQPQPPQRFYRAIAAP